MRIMMRTGVNLAVMATIALALPSASSAQEWGFPGLGNAEFAAIPAGGPAPRRDLTGAWDPGQAGIACGDNYFNARTVPPLTPLGKEMLSRNRPTHGPYTAKVFEGNDPLTTQGDPSGFPRILNYEFRPMRIVQTPKAVLMLYSFNQSWRIIWTDGRALPKDPDPRWFGYSVGRWEDDTTFVVETVGLTDRTWLDSGGFPHSEALRVQERYRRASENVIELTVTITDPLVYAKPWISRDRLPLKRLPEETDFLEQIYAASEVTGFKEGIADKARTQ
jgi:hypothetical protein